MDNSSNLPMTAMKIFAVVVALIFLISGARWIGYNLTASTVTSHQKVVNGQCWDQTYYLTQAQVDQLAGSGEAAFNRFLAANPDVEPTSQRICIN